METLACIQVLSAFAVVFCCAIFPSYMRGRFRKRNQPLKCSLKQVCITIQRMELQYLSFVTLMTILSRLPICVSLQHQFTLQLNGAGDANDIEGAFIDGFAGEPLGSVQIDFKGQCLPPNSSVVPEGPNISVIGNDAYGNGVWR